ncbi:MFS transporter, partial [Salmonella enterica subsp. enterica serovar Montevideo]|nr:MFS transporter [Salmonella enterica subsp. enterica serovar Montevideo]
VDRAAQEEEFSLELRNRDRERKLIKKIEKTLKKVEDEDFGYCSNRFGRRDSLKIAALLFFISGIGSAWPELGFTTINPDNA